MTVPNKSFIFKKIPDRVPVPGEHLVIEDRPIDLDKPAPPGGLVLEVLYASFDPYMRGRMRDPSIKSYSPAFPLNEPVMNHTISRVLKSGDGAEFAEGDIVKAFTRIAEYDIVPDPKKQAVAKIENPHNLSLSYYVGILGMPGITAWSGLYKIGKPKAGETIFISSAAGAVGQAVGQIAKKEGLKVVGSVGSDEKLEFITKELGFDAGFNYKTEPPAAALPRLTPEGIDIYFENVGGDHLEAALDNMNVDGRIPVCGMIADYNTPYEERKGIKNLFQVIAKQITMEGFLQGRPQFAPVYTKEHQEKMSAWLADGSVKAKEHITEGIDNAAKGFVGMLQGDNFGKAVLKIK